MLIRYSTPSKYDQASYGASCRVNRGSNFSIFVQKSKDDENPNWECIGEYTTDKHTDEFIETEIKNAITP